MLQFLLFSFVSVITTTSGLWERSNCLSSCITVVSPVTFQVIIVRDSADLPDLGGLLRGLSDPLVLASALDRRWQAVSARI